MDDHLSRWNEPMKPLDMNDSPNPKSRWYWRYLRRGLIGLAVLATLAAILVTEENWRGKRDWEAYKRDAEARGEQFDWSAYAPDGVPDDQNFARAPIFSSVTNMLWDEPTQAWKPANTNLVDRVKMSIYRSDGSRTKDLDGSWEQARLTPLTNWQSYYRGSTNGYPGEFPLAPARQSPAADVLLALSKYDSAIEELRVASQRPYSRLGGYAADDRDFAIRMTWLARFKGIAQVLSLRAIAELNNQQAAQALADVQLLLRLDDELRQEPLLISHLVSLVIAAKILQPVYEGLAQHRWNDEQLAALERALAAKDFLADYESAMRGERIFSVDAVESDRIAGVYKTYAGGGEIIVNMRWTPNAFFYQNELALARLNEELLQPMVDVTNRLASPEAWRQADAAFKEQKKHYSIYNVLALMAVPGVEHSVQKFAGMQADFDLAQVACVLERYHLANGEYPAALAALVPPFMEKVPHDVINGQPLLYRKMDSGSFILYSVGWNEKDDGGTTALNKDGSVNPFAGDWVWHYPTK